MGGARFTTSGRCDASLTTRSTRNLAAALASLPVSCFLLVNVAGVFLWHQRDRIRPFPALIGILTLFSVVTPLVWVTVASLATTESLDALNWPSQHMTGLAALLICPALIVWFYFLEYYRQDQTTAST